MYTRPNAEEALILAFNNSDRVVRTRLTLDLKGLGLPEAGLTAKELYHRAQVSLEGAALKVDMEPRNFQFIAVKSAAP